MNLIVFIVWATSLLSQNSCASTDSPITISRTPNNGVYTTDFTISVTCTYSASHMFDSFVHPKFGQIRATNGNFMVHRFSNIIILEIVSSTREDEGTYFCTFNPVSAGAMREHQSTEFQYREPPVIINLQLRYDALVGERANLNCRTNHTTQVQWSHSQNPVVTNERIFSEGGILIFYNVHLEDAGTYVCLAGNELLLISEEIELVVQQRPTVDVEPKILVVDLGDQAEFLCTAQGFPLPTVQWVEVATGVTVGEENTQQAVLNNNVIKYRLMFTNISNSEIGSYECKATSDAGEAAGMVILNLVGTPRAIQNVQLYLINQTNINVTWDAAPLPDIHSYTVTWLSADTEFETLSGAGLSTTYLITGLERLTRYTVFVYATNAHGRGVDSEQVNITTDALAPIGEVELFLFDTTPVSTQVKFSLSSIDNGGANVTTVQFLYSMDSQLWQSYEISSADQAYTQEGSTVRAYIEGLLPNTEYQLKAQLGNRIGFGSPSPTISFTTSPEGYPGSPSHVTISQVNVCSLFVCWEPSRLQSSVLRYNIEVALANGETRSLNVSVDDLETTSECALGVTVSELSPDSCYRFSVSATNNRGTGQSSAQSQEGCTTGLPSVLPTLGSSLVNPLSDTLIIAIVVVMGVLFAFAFVVFLLVCCCCCAKIRRNRAKYNLPETRRGSARSDTNLMSYQHQNSSDSVSPDSSPPTASTQLSNPFVFEPTSPQPDPQFYYGGSNTLGTPYSAPVQQSQQQHSSHSLPSYYNPHHTQPSGHNCPPSSQEQSDVKFTNNPYYKKFQLQNIPEQEEHINFAYVSVPPPLPSRTYYADNMSDVAPSEVSSIPVGESCSQPSSSPRLKKKKKRKHSPGHRPLPSHTIGQVDGTEFISNDAYETVPVSPAVHGHGPLNGRSIYSDVESEVSGEPRFVIQSQERGAVLETVRFKS